MGHVLDLETLADFLATADAGSVTAGARRRGQPKQTVSRRLMALEAGLGVRLFDRSTRSLRLTPEGALLQDRARRLLADVEEARRTLSDRSVSAEGLVRVSAPVLLGQTELGAVAARILARHPRMQIEIVLSDRRVDLIEEGFDAAIRVGHAVDPNLEGRVLGMAETIIVASPQAVAKHGLPARPEGLAQRPCLILGEANVPASWTLWSDTRSVTVDVTGRLYCESRKLCLDAAVAGAGFANLPAFIARPMIGQGALVRVLPKWNSGRVALRIVHSSRRLLSARLRVFIEEAAAAFAAVEF